MSNLMDALSPFDAWYEAQYPRVLAGVMLSCGNVHEASEATDEAFARAYERWDRVSRMESPGGWTQRVAFNVLRRRARRRALEQTLLRRRSVAEGMLPDQAIEAWELLATLPQRQRSAAVLRYVLDLSEPEIARIMGIRRGTVSASLVAARRSLAHQLGIDDPEARNG